jgi:glycine cleavage system H protein
VNQDPYGRGWVAVVELSNPTELNNLMTAEQYEEFLKTQS